MTRKRTSRKPRRNAAPAAWLRIGWPASGAWYGETAGKLLRHVAFAGMTGESTREADLHTVWSDYAYADAESARHDAARVAAAALLHEWTGVRAEWKRTGEAHYRSPSAGEVKRWSRILAESPTRNPRCPSCGGASHPASGSVLPSGAVVCGPCVRRFWSWAAEHGDKRYRVGPKGKGSKYIPFPTGVVR